MNRDIKDVCRVQLWVLAGDMDLNKVDKNAVSLEFTF